jgi:thioredoxin reductase
MSAVDERCHVIVIGGGAAGLSTALVLGRARTNVVLLDRGTQSNLAAAGIGGLLGHDRYPPRAFYESCRQQLAHYPTISTIAAGAATVHADHDRCRVVLGDGTRLDADHVVLATGMRYAKPMIDGIDAFWGASVFHCPFCHGWEHRDKITVAVVHDDASVERALLLTNWTDDVTAVTAPGLLSPEHQLRLIAAGVHVESGPITALHGRDRELAAVELADGSRLRAQALLIPATPVPRDDLVERAGIATTDTGHIAVDADGRTSRTRVWAVGDIADPSGTVARAIAAGATAAIAIIRDLTSARLSSRADATGTF